MSISEEQIDPDAQKVVRRLMRHGHKAYLVGGCVRDLLVGRAPKDFDVATSATPQEIKALFRNCRIIGRRFRLAHIFFGQKIIETSTFRTTPTREGEADVDVDHDADHDADGEPHDDEHADALSASPPPPDAQPELLIRHDNVFGTAEEDARRRDFTMNGLFYDLELHQVIDYVEGLPDVERRTVRTIGDPTIRFREDPVRMLRAIKFAARLDFSIEPATYQALLLHKDEIEKSAPPRVLEEIYRLLRGGAAARSLDLLDETGLGTLLLPTLMARMHANPAAAQRLRTVLAAIDEMVRRGSVPSNGLLVAVLDGVFETDLLFGPEPGPNEGRLDLVREVYDRTQPLHTALRVARRDAERARQILVAQRRLLPSKRRRTRPMALVRRDWFDEALIVFTLLHRGVGSGNDTDDIVSKWQKLGTSGGGDKASNDSSSKHDESDKSSDENAAPVDGGGGGGSADVVAAAGDKPRRRRRRGGRGRRRQPREAAEATAADLAPVAPAD